ncbi:MAG: GIY-YIG nuclease family protein [Flavobacteriales bacterium]|nr:GIY-YIG nuclease family protein [Flavobacteriales bacterium]
MDYWVYALKSEKDGRVYVGMSKDVPSRIKQHNAGMSRSTKGYRPWKLIYEEKVGKRVSAREREKYLKSGVGKEFLKSLSGNKAP